MGTHLRGKHFPLIASNNGDFFCAAKPERRRTVWKFKYFSVTHILRQIKYGIFWVSKIAILPSSAFRYVFCELLTKVEFTQKSKFRASKMAKIAFLSSWYCQIWFHVKSEWQ